MRILIVHDREEIASQIVSLARDPQHSVTLVDTAVDEREARAALRRKIYDLLIIDLTLPHIHGKGPATYESSIRLLRELYETDDLNVPADVIGLTMDVEALEMVGSDFGPHVMAIIHEGKDDGWKKQISDKIMYAAKAASTRNISWNSQYDVDLLVVTALDKELAPLGDMFGFTAHPRFPGAKTFGFTDAKGDLRRGVAYSIGKSGEARAASFTQSLLALFRPRLALMTGICGGVQGKVKLGDIVIAESAIDWDYGKWEDEKAAGPEGNVAPLFLSRPDPISIRDSRAHRVIRDLIQSDFFKSPVFREEVLSHSSGKITQPDPHLAPMASGSSVIASGEIFRRIHGLNESIRGIDMECFGFYHAGIRTHVVRPEMICIKSVSDFSNGTKNDDYHDGCAFTAALMAKHVATEIWDFED